MTKETALEIRARLKSDILSIENDLAFLKALLKAVDITLESHEACYKRLNPNNLEA